MSLKPKIKTATAALFLAWSVPAFADMRSIDSETQSSIKLAEGFYEDVLVYRNLNNFNKYVGEKYVQHAPAYGDGPVELIKAIAGELTADPNVQVDIYRTIAEGPYVAIHSVWTPSSGEEYVYIDVWRAEDGKLVEHWDHYQQVPDASENNNTMYQGPEADIYSTQDVEQNRQRAIAIVKSFENPTDLSAVKDYISAESYLQHNPHVPDGREALEGYLEYLAGEKTRLKVDIAKTIAMGDMVIVHYRQTNLDKDGDLGSGFFDIFRFDENGLAVEHWDIEEVQTDTSANENDVFGYPNG